MRGRASERESGEGSFLLLRPSTTNCPPPSTTNDPQFSLRQRVCQYRHALTALVPRLPNETRANGRRRRRRVGWSGKKGCNHRPLPQVNDTLTNSIADGAHCPSFPLNLERVFFSEEEESVVRVQCGKQRSERHGTCVMSPRLDQKRMGERGGRGEEKNLVLPLPLRLGLS